MKHKFLLVFAFVATSHVGLVNGQASISEQRGELQGKVSDAMSNNALAEVPVTMFLDGMLLNGCYTDTNGDYNIQRLLPGMYTVKLQRKGYHSIEMRGVVVNADKIRFQNFYLKPAHETETTIVMNAVVGAVKGCGISNSDDVVNYASCRGLPTANNSITIVYYVDGIKRPNLPCCPIEQVTVVTGGVPAKYENADVVAFDGKLRRHDKYVVY